MHIRIRKSWLLLSCVAALLLVHTSPARGQVVSPLQAGHYTPNLQNIRDMANPPPGLFVLWYNAYLWSNTYKDRNGNSFESIELSQIHPTLPDVAVDLSVKGFTTVPSLFWASRFKVLGANYMAGAVYSYTSADASVVTERPGIIEDTLITRQVDEKVSGLGDLFVMPLGLSWGQEKFDATLLYGFHAPTGKYETGGSDNMGLGFWTHQFQGYGYFYPVPDKSTAVMVGLTYELNGTIKDADVKPGNRFTLEYGISQFLSERLEVGVAGGHNWQVSDDSGEDVYWDPAVRDRKNMLIFNVSVWPVPERLMLNAKYGFDYGARQRFQNNYLMLNLLFVTNVLTGG
ncbi:MAG: transporter [Gemmatimonadota bacterium]|nr:MAG: transporter [Gemmatimonadota bacterium]